MAFPRFSPLNSNGSIYITLDLLAIEEVLTWREDWAYEVLGRSFINFYEILMIVNDTGSICGFKVDIGAQGPLVAIICF